MRSTTWQVARQATDAEASREEAVTFSDESGGGEMAKRCAWSSSGTNSGIRTKARLQGGLSGKPVDGTEGRGHDRRRLESFAAFVGNNGSAL